MDQIFSIGLLSHNIYVQDFFRFYEVTFKMFQDLFKDD